MKYIPGVLGALCLTTAGALVTPILGFAVAGLLLLAIDRRVN